jgi:hypothetical protein
VAGLTYLTLHVAYDEASQHIIRPSAFLFNDLLCLVFYKIKNARGCREVWPGQGRRSTRRGVRQRNAKPLIVAITSSHRHRDLHQLTPSFESVSNMVAKGLTGAAALALALATAGAFSPGTPFVRSPGNPVFHGVVNADGSVVTSDKVRCTTETNRGFGR